MEYKSSVLRCHDPADADCATCRFLSGDKSQDVLLDVISNLDHMLFDEETLTETLVKTQADLQRKVDSIPASLREYIG